MSLSSGNGVKGELKGVATGVAKEVLQGGGVLSVQVVVTGVWLCRGQCQPSGGGCVLDLRWLF